MYAASQRICSVPGWRVYCSYLALPGSSAGLAVGSTCVVVPVPSPVLIESPSPAAVLETQVAVLASGRF